MCTKQNFLDSFMVNIEFITQKARGLVSSANDNLKVHQDAWIRLVTAVYFSKHNIFFRRKSITTIYNNLLSFPDSVEFKRIFTTLGFPESHKMTSLLDWHSIVRKLTFHGENVTKFTKRKSCHHGQL